MNEPDVDHLISLRSSLRKIHEESTVHLKYLDKVDARSWKMHVLDPLHDVAQFVGNSIGRKQNR